MKSKKGFTLAEVLITLAVIGVVAALTIPVLMQVYQTQQSVTGLKKAYSTLTQVYTLAQKDNGTPDLWGLSSTQSTSSLNVLNVLAPYLKLNKNCGIDASSGCFPSLNYTYLNGTHNYNIDADGTVAKAQFTDGTSMYVVGYGDCSTSYGTSVALQHICGAIDIDINGFKSPNKRGQDLFQFWLTTSGVVPNGSQQETSSGNDFSSECQDSTYSGLGCTAWVIYNENLDYTKCSTLSWSGQHKCP